MHLFFSGIDVPLDYQICNDTEVFTL